jgi:hypothetical protein
LEEKFNDDYEPVRCNIGSSSIEVDRFEEREQFMKSNNIM